MPHLVGERAVTLPPPLRRDPHPVSDRPCEVRRRAPRDQRPARYAQQGELGEPPARGPMMEKGCRKSGGELRLERSERYASSGGRVPLRTPAVPRKIVPRHMAACHCLTKTRDFRVAQLLAHGDGIRPRRTRHDEKARTVTHPQVVDQRLGILQHEGVMVDASCAGC